MQLLVYLYITIYISAVTVKCSQFVLPATNGCGQSKMSIQADDECLSVMPIPRYNTTLGSIIRYRCSSRTDTSPKATIDYCPVQICQDNMTWSIPSLSCAKSECVGPANYYAGQRMCTTSGIACQRWSSQSPHKHNFINGAMFPEKSVTAAAAYCRDPNNIHGNPWCFTQDSNITWEYCDIPKCEDLPLVQNSCSKTDNKAVEKVDCGMPDFEIKADNACVDLAPLKPFNTTEGSRVVYSCASLQLNVQSGNGYCPVELCQKNGKWSLPYLSCAETECFIKGKSQYYRGKRTCTSKGLHCATWQYREIQTFNNSSFPEGTVAAKSFCRDPDGQKGSPWCFTDGLATTWDYCDIPRCSDISVEEASCAGNEEITTVKVSGNEFDSKSTSMIRNNNQYTYYSTGIPRSTKPVHFKNGKSFASTEIPGIRGNSNVNDYKKNNVVTETLFKTELNNTISVTDIPIDNESITSTVMNRLTRTGHSDSTVDNHAANDDEYTKKSADFDNLMLFSKNIFVTDMSTKTRVSVSVFADKANTKNIFSAGRLTVNAIITGVTTDKSKIAAKTESTENLTGNTIVTDATIDESTVASAKEGTGSFTVNTIASDIPIDKSTIATIDKSTITTKTEGTGSRTVKSIVTEATIDKSTIAPITKGTGSFTVNTIAIVASIDKSTTHAKAKSTGSLITNTIVADVPTDTGTASTKLESTGRLTPSTPNTIVTDIFTTMKYKKHFIGNTIPQEEGLSDNNITEDVYTSTKAEISDNYIVAGDPFVKKFTTMSGDVRDTSIKTRMTEEDNIVQFIPDFRENIKPTTITNAPSYNTKEYTTQTAVTSLPSDNKMEYLKSIGVTVTDTSPTTGLSTDAEITRNTVGTNTGIPKIEMVTDVTNINEHTNTTYFTQPIDSSLENDPHATIPNVVKHTPVLKQEQNTAISNVIENIIVPKETENIDISKDIEQKTIFVVTETFEKPRNEGSDTAIIKEQNKKHIAKNAYTFEYPAHNIVSTVVQYVMRHTENNIDMDKYDSYYLPERNRMHKPSTKSATGNIDKNRQTSVTSVKKYQEHFRETASESTPNGFSVPIPKHSLNLQNPTFDLYPQLLQYTGSIPAHVSFILIYGQQLEFRVVQYSSSKWNIIECARDCENNDNCALFKHRNGECVTFSFISTVRHHIYCEKHLPCYFKMTSGFNQ